MKSKELLTWGAGELAGSSPTPALDAEVLLRHAAALSRETLVAYPERKIEQGNEEEFRSFIARRAKGEPVAYIRGIKEFWGMDFAVSPAVLVPRPETELIVEKGLELIGSRRSVRVLDLGTGSGCIIVALGKELLSRGVQASLSAVDRSPAAIEIAGRNGATLGVPGIDFRVGHWFLPVCDEPPFDLVVSNPPYVSRKEALPRDLDFEPKAALFAGDDGLSDIRFLAKSVATVLSSGGNFLCEIGANQVLPLTAWAQAEGIADKFSRMEFFPDLAGIPRVLGLIGRR